MAARRIDRAVQAAGLDAARGTALRRTDPLAEDANEWYWILRVGHPLVADAREAKPLTGQRWQRADLAATEIADLNADDLDVLALSRSLKARVAAASHAKTRPETLAQLAESDSSEVSRAAGHNPHTPAAVIARLQSAFLRESGYSSTAVNPYIDKRRLQWLWLETDEWPRIDVAAAIEVIEGGGPFRDGRTMLAKRTDLSLSLGLRLASWHSLESDAAALLAESRLLAVRERIAERLRTAWDLAIATRLAKDEAAEVRIRLAASGAVPESILEALARGKDPDVRIAAGSNPRLPHDALRALLKDRDPEVRREVVIHGALEYSELAALDSTEDGRAHLQARLMYNEWPICWGNEYLYGIASNSSEYSERAAMAAASQQFLRELARSQHESTRIAVARNTGTPEDALEQLANDPIQAVRDAVCGALSWETENSGPSYYEGKPAIWWFKREDLDVQALVKSRNPQVRAEISERLSGAELGPLVGDESPAVRGRVAKNPHIRVADLATLCDDSDEGVRRAAAREVEEGLRLLKGREHLHEPSAEDILSRRLSLPEDLRALVRSSTELRAVDHRARRFHLRYLGGGSWIRLAVDPDIDAFRSVQNPSVREAVAKAGLGALTVAQVEEASGAAGNGPADLSKGTALLISSQHGSGEWQEARDHLRRAADWFYTEGQAAPDPSEERVDSFRRFAQAANNLALCLVSQTDTPIHRQGDYNRKLNKIACDRLGEAATAMEDHVIGEERYDAPSSSVPTADRHLYIAILSNLGALLVGMDVNASVGVDLLDRARRWGSV